MSLRAASVGILGMLAVSAVWGAEVRRVLPPPRVIPPPKTVPANQYTPAASQVELFVTSWCPHCRALESELTARGISFTRYDIEHDPRGKQIYAQLGRRGLPTTRIGSQIIVGNRLNAILAALGRSK